MKKTGLIFIFIFMTGLFSGLFFSTNLSDVNSSYLSSLLLSSFSDSDAPFTHVFFSSLLSNFTLILLMLPALISKYLCPLPPLILWYKSFAIGFCSGLVYINAAADAFLLSLVKLFPQNIFFIPAFTVLAAVFFSFSLKQSFRPAALLQSGSAGRYPGRKKSRSHLQNRLLLYAVTLAAAFILLGALIEAIL